MGKVFPLKKARVNVPVLNFRLWTLAEAGIVFALHKSYLSLRMIWCMAFLCAAPDAVGNVEIFMKMQPPPVSPMHRDLVDQSCDLLTGCGLSARWDRRCGSVLGRRNGFVEIGGDGCRCDGTAWWLAGSSSAGTR